MNISALCIIENSNKQLLLLDRKYSPFGWGLVGGKIDSQNESIKEGLVREIYEEIGAKVKLEDLIFTKESYSQNGDKVYIYTCTAPINKVTLSEEHTGYCFISLLTSSVKFAGRTEDFLSNYVFDGSKVGLNYRLTFGKHYGKTIKELVYGNEFDYLKWFNKTIDPLQNSVLNLIDKLEKESGLAKEIRNDSGKPISKVTSTDDVCYHLFDDEEDIGDGFPIDLF